MRSKKQIMGLAALMVAFFHFYIPFGNIAFEMFLFKSSFVGVDLFFFVSASSIGSRNKDSFDFGSFILNRLSYIYVPFVVMTIICAIYKKWKILRVIEVITGYEFIRKGGGSFLWYFVGIMLVYLMMPLFLVIKRRFKTPGILIMFSIWLLIASICQFLLKQPQLFILINRLPVFFVGLYFDEMYKILESSIGSIRICLLGLVLFVSGEMLVYEFATFIRFNKPFSDMYYVVALPLSIGIVLLAEYLCRKYDEKFMNKAFAFIGGITLEMYGLQMIFGYDIESFLLKISPIKQLAFLGVIIVLIIISTMFNKMQFFVRDFIKRINKKEV